MEALRLELIKVTVGTLLLSFVSAGAGALAGYWNLGAARGLVLGCVLALANFYLLSWHVVRVVKKSPKDAQLSTLMNHYARLGMIALVLILAFKSPLFQPIFTVLPLFFPQAVLYAGMLRKKGGER